MGTRVLTTSVILLLCVAAPAADKVVMDATIGWEGCIRPMEWAPVDVTIESELKNPVEAELSLEFQQDQLTTMTLRHPVTLQKKMTLRVPLVAKFAAQADQCSISLDAGWRSVVRRNVRFYEYASGPRAVVAMNSNDMLIGVSGSRRFGIAQTSRRTASRYEDTPAGKVHVAYKQSELLPWDWPGYAAVDLLVLYDVDWGTAVRPEQAKAIVDWVNKGGRLLLLIGSRPLPPDGPVAGMLPMTLGPARQTRLSAQALRRWGCKPRPGGDEPTDLVACWTIEKVSDPRWQTVISAGGMDKDGQPLGPLPVFAHGPVGFGRVAVVPFDPATIGGLQDANLAEFWVEHAGLLAGQRKLVIGSPAEGSSDPSYPGSYNVYEDVTIAEAGSNAIMDHLFSIPELRPLSIWVVIVVLLALAVVIGPLDYLALRLMDRLPLTWITSAAWVALFTVGAYYGVEKLRSGAAQVKMVTVTDAVADAEGKPAAGWATTYMGIYAPVSDDYDLRESDGGALAGLQWWSSVNPVRSGYDPFGTEQATRRIGCRQHDGGNLPVSVPINIWTMQCLIRESPAADTPLSARVAVNGDVVTLNVVNRADRPIADGCVRFGGNRLMRFGAVPPGETLNVRGRLMSADPWDACMGDKDSWFREYEYEGRPSQPFTGEQAYFARGSLGRTRAIEACLENGQAVVCARYDGASPACTLGRGGGQYDHLQLARLVVQPEKGSRND